MTPYGNGPATRPPDSAGHLWTATVEVAGGTGVPPVRGKAQRPAGRRSHPPGSTRQVNRGGPLVRDEEPQVQFRVPQVEGDRLRVRELTEDHVRGRRRLGLEPLGHAPVAHERLL